MDNCVKLILTNNLCSHAKSILGLSCLRIKALEPTMHPYKIQIKLAKVNSFKYSFFVRMVKDGNSLPKHLFTDDINVNKI